VEQEQDTVIGAGLLAGTANVIMQLSKLPVGYGVLESRVESGNIFKHPVKRTRTTLTYLAVVSLGTDEERRAYRRAVNGAHAQVRSTESSPVSYNAFDPSLQLWVAACLYRGLEDTCAAFGAPVDEAELDRRYQEASRLGTTLQVPRESWPADREAFTRYWDEQVAAIRLDDTVRRYLHDLVELRYLPRPLAVLGVPLHRFVTTGFLPPRFREEMRLPWSPRQQRRFDRLTGAINTFVRALPAPVRQFPFNAYLWDLRRRLRRGLPLV